ncbi:DUF1036 domain-containing protein [Desulfovibrio sp. OttesenSCG-928-A18]|nr:DUF1036 domain-containing protein [Desulfovibrio sp. OttesenSCG-928-A18]
MFRRSLWKCLPLLVLVLCLLAGAASAKTVKVTNKTTNKIYIAFCYKDARADDWIVRGWFNVDGLGATSINLNTNNSIIYFLGTSGKARWGGRKGSSDALALPVVGDKFMYKHKKEKPRGSNYRTEYFKKRQSSNDGVFYINFSD